MTQTKFIVKIKRMNKSVSVKAFLLVILLIGLLSCGDFNDDQRPNDEFYPTVLPISNFTLEASISFNPVEREQGSFEVPTNSTLIIPLELNVLSGNSGVGFASIKVNGRKFCFKGNAVDESDPSGTSYFFVYEKTNPVSICSITDGTEAEFNQRVDVDGGDEVLFEIEEAGCSLEADTCLSTVAEANFDVEGQDP